MRADVAILAAADVALGLIALWLLRECHQMRKSITVLLRGQSADHDYYTDMWMSQSRWNKAATDALVLHSDLHGVALPDLPSLEVH